LFKKKGNVRKVRRRFGSFYSRKVLIRDNDADKYFIFCLEDLILKEIPMPYNPYFYIEKGNRFIIVWASGDEMSVGEINDDQLVMKKEWVTSIPIRDIRILRVFNSGLIIYNRKEFETYWFEL
jgi:hypothetical protein